MKRITLFLGARILILCSTVFAVVPQLINFQGILKDGSGNPVANGSYSVVFTIYDAASGGTNLWTETQSVTTTGGLFAVLLGSTNPVPDSVFKGIDRYLGIAVSPDPELSPRQRLVSIGYAYRVGSVDGASGGTINGAIDAPGMSSKIRFHYNDVSELPSPTTYHGMFAHAHNQGAAYYAHAGQWVRLADSAHPHSSLAASDLSPNPALSVDADGKVGIGTTTPSAKLEVLNFVSSTTAEQGVSGIVSNSSTGSAFGGIFTASSAGTGIKSGVRGNASSASANPAYGIYGEADNSSTGDAYGGFFNVPSSGGSGISYGVYSAIASATGWGFYTPNRTYLGGNVGVGTTSPAKKLDVVGSIKTSDTLFASNVSSNSPLRLQTAGTTRMYIDNATGNVGIGTTSPGNRLSVVGAADFTGKVGIGTAGPGNNLSVAGTADFTGNVGIGTTSPGSRLDVAGGNFNLENSTVSRGNILKGGDLFIHNFGTENTFIGHNAGNLTTSGVVGRNTASGAFALGLNTTGYFNTASGAVALGNNTTGFSNTASGNFALGSNTTGTNNTAIGALADVSVGVLTNATAIGSGAIVNASNKIRLGNASVTVIEGQVDFTFTSDKNQKENFRPVDGNEVLKKIRGLELSSWNYKGHDPEQFRHYGPMAQDFFAAFGDDGVGKIGTETTLNSGDMAGILMVAVQTLGNENADLKARIEQLEGKLDKLQAEKPQAKVE